MPLPQVHMECRAVADPELRFSPSGVAVCRIRCVSSSRKKVGDEWVDDKTCWIDVTSFGKYGENVAESVQKGDILLITGRLETQEWERDGQKHSKICVLADEVAASLRFRTIPHGAGKAERSSAKSDDPWASAPPPSDEPPF